MVLDTTGSMGARGKMDALKISPKALSIRSSRTSRPEAGSPSPSCHSALRCAYRRVLVADWIDFKKTNRTPSIMRCRHLGRLHHGSGQAVQHEKGSPDERQEEEAHPAQNCAVSTLEPILPLTSSAAAARDKIDALSPGGNTNTTIGMAWGYNVLTPGNPLGDAAAPASLRPIRVMVFLTDGLNTEDRFSQPTAAMDKDMRELCKSAATSGIRVFTIRVVEGNDGLLRDCASSPSDSTRRMTPPAPESVPVHRKQACAPAAYKLTAARDGSTSAIVLATDSSVSRAAREIQDAVHFRHFFHRSGVRRCRRPHRRDAGLAQQCITSAADFPSGWRASRAAREPRASARARSTGASRGSPTTDGHQPRPQSEFVRLSFEEFYRRRVSDAMIQRGAAGSAQNRGLATRLEQQFGVPAEILVSIWALETNFGAQKGNLPIIPPVATLAADCRRQAFFENELMAALKIVERGEPADHQMRRRMGRRDRPDAVHAVVVRQLRPSTTTGTGTPTSSPRCRTELASTANFLRRKGWQRGGGWNEGEANWQPQREWNKATVYMRTIGVMATRMRGPGRDRARPCAPDGALQPLAEQQPLRRG